MLGGWLLALVALAGLAMAFKGTFSDEFKVPGTESQRAIELIERDVPQANADGADRPCRVRRRRRASSSTRRRSSRP